MPSLSDLLRMGKQYIGDALPGGSLNPEVSRQSVLDGAAMALSPVPVLGDIVGLGADANRYATDPESRTPVNYGLTALGALPFIPSVTAWHGSPHKFDKFSLDKIGTGEGAQAYGHGLYLAESPGVASGYRDKLAKNEVLLDGLKVKHDRSLMDPQSMGLNALQMEPSPKSAADALRKAVADDSLWGRGSQYDQRANYSAAADWLEQNAKRIQVDSGHLYKTDIPDEAVARFLDWDKPLSQQAEAMSVFRNAGVDVDKEMLSNLGEIIKKQKGIPYASSAPDVQGIMGRLVKKLGSKDAANDYLVQNGIPGIRYLDGGSRSAGQGSSNFVAFDPEMIRILERNGIPTGNKPWNPGEWRPMSDLMNPRID